MRRSAVLGIEIDALTMDDVMDRIHDAISTRTALSIGVVNAAKLVNMRQDERLRRDVSSSQLVLADGMSVVWASRILGQPLPERVSGIDLMHEMMKWGNEHRYRFFLFGAREDVLQSVMQKMAELYPNAIVAGHRNGYFGEADEQTIVGQIAASNADILLVAITSPIKERFMAKWREALNVTVTHGVGGSFDVMAGNVRRAPAMMQRLGLEWLYRVLQEPGRLAWRYIRTNTLFITFISREWLSRALTRN